MKITLDRLEVFEAVRFYLMFKGHDPVNGITEHWTNENGLHHVDVIVKPHNYTDESILKVLKEN